MTRRSQPILWAACLAGREPAESLSTWERAQLVAVLTGQGWSLLDVATHTRMTTYTTARILAGLERSDQQRRGAA